MEEYRPVTGYEGLYSISNYGKLLSMRMRRQMKTWKNNKGYETCSLCSNGEEQRFLVHRLVAQSFIANPLKLPVVNHKDFNPSNNHVENLEWCTISWNAMHAYKNGRLPKPPTHRGEELLFAKMTEAKVLELRRLREAGAVYTELASKFGIHLATAQRIATRKTWKHM